MLRLWQIASPRLWYDEIGSLWMASLPFADMLRATAGDVHPPLYLALLWGWVRVFGYTALAARVLSAILSLAGLWPFAEIMRVLGFAQRDRLLAGLLFIVSPYQLYYAQEARMYALLQLLVLFGAWAALDDRPWVVGMAISGLLWTHNYGFIYAAVLMLVYVMRYGIWKRDDQWGWPSVGVMLLGFGTYLPWALVLAGQLQAARGGWWQQPVTPGMALETFRNFLFGDAFPGGSFGALTLALTGALLALVGWRMQFDLMDLQVLAAGPLFLAATLSAVYRPIWLDRALIGAAPFYYMMLAWALYDLRPRARWLAVTALGVTLALAVLAYAPWQAITKGFAFSYRDQIDYQPGDVIYHINPGTLFQVHNDWPEAPRQYAHPAFPGDLGGLSDQTVAALGVTQKPLENLYWVRAWVFFSASPTVSASQDAYMRYLLERYPHSRRVIDLGVPWVVPGLIGGGIWLIQR